MYANKVILNGVPIVDLTGDTSLKEDVYLDKSFHLATGEKTLGTALRSKATGEPIEISTVAEMNERLANASPNHDGTVFKYIGETSGGYIQNGFYRLEVIE